MAEHASVYFQKYKPFAEDAGKRVRISGTELIAATSLAEPEYRFDLLEIALVSENLLAVAEFLKTIPIDSWRDKFYGESAIGGVRCRFKSNVASNAGDHGMRLANFAALKNSGMIDRIASLREMSVENYIGKLMEDAVSRYGDYEMCSDLMELGGKLIGVGENRPYHMLGYLYKIDFERGIQLFDALLVMYNAEIQAADRLDPNELIKNYVQMALHLIASLDENDDYAAAYMHKLMDHPLAPHKLYPADGGDIAKLLAYVYMKRPTVWAGAGYSVKTEYGHGVTIVKYLMEEVYDISHMKDDEFDAFVNRMRADKISAYYRDPVPKNAFSALSDRVSGMSYVGESLTPMYAKCMKIFYMFVDRDLNINTPNRIDYYTGHQYVSLAIHYASELGIDHIKELISKGFDVSRMNSNDLYQLIRNGESFSHPDGAETRLKLMLINGANPYKKELRDKSLLEKYVKDGNAELVNIITSFNPMNVVRDNSTILDRILEAAKTDTQKECIAIIRSAGAKLASEMNDA